MGGGARSRGARPSPSLGEAEAGGWRFRPCPAAEWAGAAAVSQDLPRMPSKPGGAPICSPGTREAEAGPPRELKATLGCTAGPCLQKAAFWARPVPSLPALGCDLLTVSSQPPSGSAASGTFGATSTCCPPLLTRPQTLRTLPPHTLTALVPAVAHRPGAFKAELSKLVIVAKAAHSEL